MHFERQRLTAAAAGALTGMAGERLCAQGADPNAAPNPYKMQDNWLQLPAGRTLGGAIKVQVDHGDGKSIWVFDRCEQTNCRLPDPQVRSPPASFALGANMFVQPHGFYVDYEGNVWAADNGIRNGKGGVVVKFSPTGQVLMTLGHQGMPGNAEGYFNGASSVVVGRNGDIFVGDGHGGNTNDRVVKFDKTGKQILTFGKHGKGPGEFDALHGIAMDSQGRIFVADRTNSRIQVFDFERKVRRRMEAVRPAERRRHRQERRDLRDGRSVEPDQQSRLQDRHPHRKRQGRQGHGLHSDTQCRDCDARRRGLR